MIEHKKVLEVTRKLTKTKKIYIDKRLVQPIPNKLLCLAVHRYARKIFKQKKTTTPIKLKK